MTKTSKKTRPMGVTILAILIYIFGVFTLVRGLVFTGTVTFDFFETPSWAAGNEILLGIFWIVIALLVMAVGTGLWGLRKRAWLITTFIVGIGLFVSAIGLTTTLLTFSIYLILFLYLLAVYKKF